MTESKTSAELLWKWQRVDRRSDRARRFWRIVNRLSRGLDLRPPGGDGGRAAGGHLFPEAPQLVRELAWAVHAEPHLFPDFRHRPEHLVQRQWRVGSLGEVEWVLEDLLRRVRRTRVEEQSELVQIAVRYSDKIDRDDAEFCESLTGQEQLQPEVNAESVFRARRRMALQFVRELLRKRRSRCRPKKDGPKKPRSRKGTPAGRARAGDQAHDLWTEELKGKRR